MTRAPIGTEIEAGSVPAWRRLAGACGALALGGLALPALVVAALFLGLRLRGGRPPHHPEHAVGVARGWVV